MKKNFLLSIGLLLASLAPVSVWAEVAYSVFDNGTLTFYYDNSKSSRTGSVYDIETEYVGDNNFPAWQTANITKVVFDNSFSAYSPTCTSRWFHSCSNITAFEGTENLNTSNVTSMAGMFYKCSSLTNIDLSHFNTSKVTNMYCIFYECSKLEKLDLRSFDTKNVTTMVAMFYGCSALKEINLSSFNTEKVEDMQYMFFKCSQLTELDISSFHTPNLTNMESMFDSCTSLVTIYAGDGWNTDKIDMITGGMWVFDNCSKLVGGEGTACATSFITSYLYAKVDSYTDPGYFTYKSSTDIKTPTKLNDDNGIIIYSIEGRRQYSPIKGLNIINGKKYLIK